MRIIECIPNISEGRDISKINAMAQYESQKHRPYANEQFIRGLATTRGVQIGVSFAEVFEVVRWIL
jgi:hypothetical protein